MDFWIRTNIESRYENRSAYYKYKSFYTTKKKHLSLFHKSIHDWSMKLDYFRKTRKRLFSKSPGCPSSIFL